MPSPNKDPVCGIMVDPEAALSLGGYSFCSEDCRNRFIVYPGRYAARS